jgi:hypothetical protein
MTRPTRPQRIGWLTILSLLAAWVVLRALGWL